MEIKVTSKYNIGDTVYSLENLEVEQRVIDSIHTLTDKRGTSIFYSFTTLVGVKNEDELFPSFEELIRSIKLKKE